MKIYMIFAADAIANRISHTKVYNKCVHDTSIVMCMYLYMWIYFYLMQSGGENKIRNRERRCKIEQVGC